MWRVWLEGNGKPSRSAVLALAAIVAVVALGEAWTVAQRLAQTSDSAQSFVEAGDVVSGNVFLAGWNVPLDDYYFTDTLPYAMLEAVLGSRPFLLALVPALTYALFAGTGAALALARARTLADAFVTGAGAVFLLGVPTWMGSWNPLLLSNMHFASATLGLIALALCARAAEAGQQNAMLDTAVVVLTAALVASDPFSLVFSFGPALLLLAFDAVTAARPRTALLLLVQGTWLGLIAPLVLAHIGGFTTENITVVSPIAPKLLLRNLAALGGGVLTLIGASPFGVGSLLADLRGVGLILAFGAIVRATFRLFLGDEPMLDRFLCAGALVTLAACAISTQFGKGIEPEQVWQGGPPMRYAMPAVLFALVLAARMVPELLPLLSERFRAAVGLMLAAAAGLVVFVAAQATIGAAPLWIDNNPSLRVADWLASRNLLQGEGEYWSANLVTAMSGNRVRVRSVVPEGGVLVPYVLAADRNAFRQPPQFVIWQEPNKTGITAAQARATHPYLRVDEVAGYRIALLNSPTIGAPAR